MTRSLHGIYHHDSCTCPVCYPDAPRLSQQDPQAMNKFHAQHEAFQRAFLRQQAKPTSRLWHPIRRPSDLMHWSLRNVLSAFFHGIVAWGFFALLSLVLFGVALLAGKHEALLIWSGVCGFFALVLMIFSVIAQITNGERW